MRDQRINVAAPPDGPARRTCSRCGEEKPSSSFYKNPRSICKSCHNKASRFTGACRRAAIAHLISTYSTEYRVLVEAERSRRRSTIDRKSTRLNSSHVEISYAVFCLKK